MVSFFFMHVGSRIHMDHKSNAGNDEKENTGELVYLESKRDVQVPYINKVEIFYNRISKNPCVFGELYAGKFIKAQENHYA